MRSTRRSRKKKHRSFRGRRTRPHGRKPKIDQKTNVYFGTWNIRGALSPTALRGERDRLFGVCSALRQRKVLMAAITETRSTNLVDGDKYELIKEGEFEKETVVVYSGKCSLKVGDKGSSSIGGVGFVVRPGVKVISFDEISHRLAVLKFVIHGYSYTMIVAYGVPDLSLIHI